MFENTQSNTFTCDTNVTDSKLSDTHQKQIFCLNGAQIQTTSAIDTLKRERDGEREINTLIPTYRI